MAKDKISKKELQGPDRFQEVTTTWLDWGHEHPKQVLLIAGGLLLALVAIGVGVEASGKPRLDPKAGAALSKALALVDKDVVEGVEGGADKESFASEQQKQEALAQALVEVRTKHPGTPAANLAALSLADARYKLGAHDEALSLYDEFLGKADKADPLRALALEGRGMALEAKGDLAGAIAAYDKLASELPKFEDRALYGKGRVLEKQQKWDDARAAYEKLKKEHEDSPVTRMSTDRLNALNLAHPPPAGAAAKSEG